MMEKDEQMTIVDLYLNYWRTYLQPLEEKEPQRYLQFVKIMNEVGKQFYGPAFIIELNVAIFRELDRVPAEAVSD